MEITIWLFIVPVAFFLVGKWLESLPETPSEPQPGVEKVSEPVKRSAQEIELSERKDGKIQIMVGAGLLILFVLFGDSIFAWTDMSWEGGLSNIFKFPVAFLIATGGIILWPVLSIALIYDGYKKKNRL